MLRSKKAQSTLEYIIIFTAIVGAVLLAANTIIKPKVGNIIDHAATQAETAVEHISFE
ncbi:MAG: class III signal peptide-containing protein [Candidatus Omnitrophota bacterium]